MKKLPFIILSFLMSFLPLSLEAQVPDPYKFGDEGQMTLWVSSAAPYYGIYAYDYDNDREVDQYAGSWKTYPTIGIGEYEVISENVLLHYRNKWAVEMGWMNFTQTIVDGMNQNYEGKNNIDRVEFQNVNGSYIPLHSEASSYRNDFRVYKTDRATLLSGWDLISSTDFMQMFGQAPAETGNPIIDIMNFLGASTSDVPADYKADWFNDYKNTSGFTMTPLGRRHSGVNGENGQKWFNYKTESGIRLKDYPTGMILFNRSQGIEINPVLYHLCQARYARAKTDDELGYKLYVDNCNDAVVMLPVSKVTQLTELPKGLERGVALRYANRSQMKIYRKWSEICAEADGIRQAIPTLPERVELPESPCEEYSPDPYEKGAESSVFISIPTGTYASRGRNLSGYDYDNNVATGWFNPIEKTYKTIDIDEYTWTTENLRIRYHDLTWINHEEEDLDYYGNKYMAGQKLSWEEFDGIFGSWISEDYNAQAYRYTHEVFDQKNGTVQEGWGMPSSEDIWQLYGQAPKLSENYYENIKDFLFASTCDNTYDWSEDMFNRRNISGLTLMPLGVRESSPNQVKPDRDRKGFGEVMNWVTDQEAKREILMNSNWDPTTLTGTSKGVVTHPKTYYWGQARYRRAKTAEELGYRLYIDQTNDQILMLPHTQVSSLPELPKGLERGIALRYTNREQMMVLRKWSEIQQEAIQIRGNLTVDLPGAETLSCDEMEDLNNNNGLTENELRSNHDDYLEDPMGEFLSDYSLKFSYNQAGERIERKVIVLETRVTKTPEEDETIKPFTDKINEQLVKIYPNPTEGQLAIEIPDMDRLNTGSLTIYNLNGQVILKQNIHSNRTDLNISGQPSGTYVLHINMNGKVSSWKIIKK